jgi:riboflavin kinase/FMN adenylyltransferase
VLTFRNHPATHLRPDRVPPLLTTLEERVNLLAATGIDELFSSRSTSASRASTRARFARLRARRAWCARARDR